MKSATLFIHGRYRRQDFTFYRQTADRSMVVAVDGGYRFCRQAGISPDLLVGDFDSLGRRPSPSEGLEIHEFSTQKDRSDTEIALRLCLDRGLGKVVIVNPSVGETDHFLGNLFLLRLAKRLRPDLKAGAVTILNPRYCLVHLADERWTVAGSVGAVLSVLPLSERIILSCRGTQYRVKGVTVEAGGTHALRNQVSAKRAVVEVEGEALVYVETIQRSR